MKKPRTTPLHWSLALALFVVVCGLHFWRLDSAPPGFSGDECAFAYNAYCIARTGADEYGTPWPMFFRSYNTYAAPAAVYPVAPVLARFGLERWAARMPTALLALAAAGAFGLMMWEFCRKRWWALAGSGLFSVVPWTFVISRDCSFAGHAAALLGLMAGMALTVRALTRRSYGCAMLAGAAWALPVYAQQSARLIVVLLPAGAAVVLWRILQRRGRAVLAIAISALIFLLPMIVNALRFPKSFTARFEQVGISHQSRSMGSVLLDAVGRYVDYFSPRFLFISGDNELRHHTGFGGELYWCLIPLLLAGLYVAIRYWRRQPWRRVVMVGLLVSPIPAALTVDRMHSTRCITGVIFWLALAVIGASALWRHKRLGRKLLVVVCATGLIESGAYLSDYYGPYQTRCRKEFQASFTDALKYCFDHIRGDQVFYVSGSVGTTGSVSLDSDFKPFVYTYLLFYGRIDPWSYQHGGFSNSIVRPYLEEIDRPGLLLRCNYKPDMQQTLFMAVPNTESIPTNSTLLATFNEKPLQYEVYEVSQ